MKRQLKYRIINAMTGDIKVLVFTRPGGEYKKSEKALTRKSKTDIKAKMMVQIYSKNGEQRCASSGHHTQRHGACLRESKNNEGQRGSVVTGY